jgi:hypothetical protein
MTVCSDATSSSLTLFFTSKYWPPSVALLSFPLRSSSPAAAAISRPMQEEEEEEEEEQQQQQQRSDQGATFQ